MQSFQKIPGDPTSLFSGLFFEKIRFISKEFCFCAHLSKKQSLKNAFLQASYLAAEEGFEPSQTESESGVLPLHNSAKRKSYYTFFSGFVNSLFTIFLHRFSDRGIPSRKEAVRQSDAPAENCGGVQFCILPYQVMRIAMMVISSN